MANVCPFFNKSDPSKPCNYRPISLLSCLGKLIERCIHKHLYNYVISNKMLTSFQCGFTKGDSSVNQLAFILHQWLPSSLVLLLSFRTQRTGSVIQLCFKILSTINAGVPQCSIIGPLLFLIFINDIVNDIKANIRLFADDTSLYIIVEDPVAYAAVLNHDLSQISSWSKKWLVNFNPSKTESVISSRKHQKQHHPSLYLDNVPISQVITLG